VTLLGRGELQLGYIEAIIGTTGSIRDALRPSANRGTPKGSAQARKRFKWEGGENTPEVNWAENVFFRRRGDGNRTSSDFYCLAALGWGLQKRATSL